MNSVGPLLVSSLITEVSLASPSSFTENMGRNVHFETTWSIRPFNTHSDEDKLSILKIICHMDMRLSCVKVAKYSLHLAEINWFLANFARSIIQGSDNTWPRLVCIAITSAWVLCQNSKNSIFFLCQLSQRTSTETLATQTRLKEL